MGEDEGVSVLCEWALLHTWAGPQAPPGPTCDKPNQPEPEGALGHPGQQDQGDAPRTIKLAPCNPQTELNGDNRLTPLGDQEEGTGVGAPGSCPSRPLTYTHSVLAHALQSN